MNPLLKKEIRLLLPAWTLTVLLVFVSVFWLYKPSTSPEEILAAFMPVFFGVMILCASSFGREFGLGTFSTLMAQPLPRRRIWLIKVGVLAAALATVTLVFFITALIFSGGFFEALTFQGLGRLLTSPWTLGLYVILLTAIASGLWVALLIRQMMAIVWLVGLAPSMVCLPFLLVLAHYNASDTTVNIILAAVMLVYSVAGIVASWFMFRCAQDVPWTGGTINLPDWVTGKIMPRIGADERLRVPWRALIWKELHFNQVLLFGMGGLFLFDLAEVGARFFNRTPNSDLNPVLQGFGIMLWVLMPLIIGCTSIAEERKLGTMEGQLCQPVSRRRQFLVKLCFVVLFGGLLSSLLPIATESLAWTLGVNKDGPPLEITILSTPGMCAIALVGFFASSLARNVLQALPIAIGMIVGIGFVISGMIHFSGLNGVELIPGFVFWSPLLSDVILALVLPVALVWLAWGNFRRLHEAARIWWRNSLGLVAALVLTAVASVMIYHRVWDQLTPFEPMHGAARWTMANAPALRRTDLYDNLLVSLPDGRTWFGCLAEDEPTWLANRYRFLFHELLPARPAPHLAVGQFISGSDWVSLAVGHKDRWINTHTGYTSEFDANAPVQHVVNSRETVGIRSDGTLWVSEDPARPEWKDGPMVQFGTENDWQQVVGDQTLGSVLLLKKDGTLWRWGDKLPAGSKPTHGEGLRAYAPRQIGTNTDWQVLDQIGWKVEAQKADGSVWQIWFDDKSRRDVVVLNTDLGPAGFTGQRLAAQKMGGGDSGADAGIRPDGTLWIFGNQVYRDLDHQNKFAVIESSAETNWVAVAVRINEMVALKSDGTLWRWGSEPSQWALHRFAGPPERLGIRQDWVAVVATGEGMVSLAADGSLWFWPDSNINNDGVPKLIEPSQKPIPLGNVLAVK